MDERIKLIQELLRQPAESLEVEIKNWLNLNEKEKKADLAKELIALANHGGGYIIFGFDETNGQFSQSQRPEDITSYNQDHINGIVERYADPTFHCEVLHVKHPDSEENFAVIEVPGGHTVPIHAKRNGPNGQHIRQLACYIRRAGGKSEMPQNSGEWQVLLQRCVRNNQEQLLDAIRGVVTGGVSAQSSPSNHERLSEWIEQSKRAWEAKVHSYEPDSLPKYPHGAFTCAFFIANVEDNLHLSELSNVIRDSSPKVSGWSPFFAPRPQHSAPYRSDDVLEAFLYEESGPLAQPFRTVFWRVSSEGFGYSINGYQEDGRREPGTVIDPKLQARLVAEYLMFIANFTSKLTEGNSQVLVQFDWTELAGRRLEDLLSPFPNIHNQVSGSEQVTTESTFELARLQNNLPEATEEVISKLFDHFSFFRAPGNFYQEQVNFLRRQSYP